MVVVLLELTVINYEKGVTKLEDLRSRLKAIHAEKFNVLLMNLVMFVQKITLLEK